MKMITFIATKLIRTVLVLYAATLLRTIVVDEITESNILALIATIVFVLIPIAIFVFFEETIEIKILACIATILAILIPIAFLLHETMGVNTDSLLAPALFILVPIGLLVVIYLKIKNDL